MEETDAACSEPAPDAHTVFSPIENLTGKSQVAGRFPQPIPSCLSRSSSSLPLSFSGKCIALLRFEALPGFEEEGLDAKVNEISCYNQKTTGPGGRNSFPLLLCHVTWAKLLALRGLLSEKVGEVLNTK